MGYQPHSRWEKSSSWPGRITSPPSGKVQRRGAVRATPGWKTITPRPDSCARGGLRGPKAAGSVGDQPSNRPRNREREAHHPGTQNGVRCVTGSSRLVGYCQTKKKQALNISYDTWSLRVYPGHLRPQNILLINPKVTPIRRFHLIPTNQECSHI